MSLFDPSGFRQALGSFATGVTVITSIDENGEPVGVTVSSFNSVSLDPPLVLWSLAKDALSLPVFKRSDYFCVHVLAASQQAISCRFASKGLDKFDGIEWTKGHANTPLLSKYAARFQCKTTHQYEGGDHIIFVGEVFEYDQDDTAPLVFHGGKYALAKAKESDEMPGDAVNVQAGTFSNQFFLYLLARAHYQATYKIQKTLRKENMYTDEYLALILFGMGGSLSIQGLHARMEHTGYVPSKKMMTNLQNRGLITEAENGDQFCLTFKGRELYICQLAKSKAIEEEILDDFSPAEVADIRNFLNRLIDKTNPGIPDFWQSDEYQMT